MTTDNNRFIGIREDGDCLVDKTALIGRMISDSGSRALMFCRPHGFGKSLNLSMLEAFLNMRHRGNSWFDGLLVSGCGNIGRYGNRFPVVRLDLGGLGCADPDEMKRRFGTLVTDTFDGFGYLSGSDRLTRSQRMRFDDIRDGTADVADIAFLTECLHAHHGVPAVVLVDGCCAPAVSTIGMETNAGAEWLQAGMLSPLLDGNPHVFRTVLADVVLAGNGRMAPVFDGVKVSSVFDDRGYGDMFGFTEDEVELVCGEIGQPERADEIVELCRRSRIGDRIMYNPESVMDRLDGGTEPDLLRIEDDDVLMGIISENDGARGVLRCLAAGEPADIWTTGCLRLPRREGIGGMDPDDVLNLMAQRGFLAVERTGMLRCRVSVPDPEAGEVLERIARR